MEKEICYLSFYTNEYENIYLTCLKKSLDKFNLPYIVYKVPSKKSWLLNANHKYNIILKELECTYHSYLVYLDADAEILQYPKIFYEITDDYDLGVCYLDWKTFWNSERQKPELLGGTLYIKKSEKTIKLFNAIVDNLKTNTKWGQQILEEILLNSNEYKIYNLPLSYCQIIKKDNIIPKNTVIAQWQASRKMKYVI